MKLRVLVVVMLALLSTGCGSMLQGLQDAAQTKVQRMLSNAFGKKLLEGIDWVITDLAKEGGFLDDPLVRILMPPPLGLVLDVSRDLYADPKAALLETLMNRAAENAIPVAGPILKDVIMNMDAETLASLADSPKGTATEYLKEKGGLVIQKALLPAVTKNLEANGAIKLYGELLQAHQGAEAKAAAVETADGTASAEPAPEPVSQEQLGQYVAEQAVGGFFKKMAVKELAIRDELDRKFEAPF